MEVLIPILLVAVLVIMILIFLFVVLQMNKYQSNVQELLHKNEESSIKDMYQLKSDINGDLIKFQTRITESLKTDFNQLNENTTKRLIDIEGKVNEGLFKGFESTNKSFVAMREQLAKIDETQENLKSLSTSVNSLQSVLTDKKLRGIYGEVELYALLENAYGVSEERYSKQYKLSNGNIVDAILFAKKPLGNIVVDSKFPLENYNRMHDDTISADEQRRARNEFKRNVLKHFQDIKEKYLEADDIAEFAYMFVPAEAIFAEINGKFQDLVQLSYQYKVYLVSPTTLMAYITAIKAIYLGQERNEKLELIQEEYLKLAKEFERFEQRFSSVARDFERTTRSIEEVSITSRKIINRFKEIESVKIDESVKNENAVIE